MATDTYCGPIDYVVFELPPGARPAQGLRLLLDQVDRGAIVLLDLEVVGRSPEGTPQLLTLDALSDEGDELAAAFDGASSGVLDSDDLAAVAESLAPGAIGIAIVYEDRSLAGVARAWQEQGGAELWSGGIDIAALAHRLETSEEEN